MSTINEPIMDHDGNTDRETIDIESTDEHEHEHEHESIDQNETVTEEVVYGYNEKTDNWHCTQCGVNMGPNNPRQLCCKYYCPEANFY